MFGPHFNIAFLGGGGSILSEPSFRGKYSKIKHIRCIFLNIFVQDCRMFLTDNAENLLYLQSWTKVLEHFRVSEAFFNAHKSNPPLTPQTKLNECIQNFLRDLTLYRVGGGRTARHFRKGCTVLRGNREMNIAVLSQGLLSRIVVQ